MSPTTRRHTGHRAFTIIESLVVLLILAVLSMVILALFKHHQKSGLPPKTAAPEATSLPALPTGEQAPE